jgi:hypothetical protein
MAILFEFRRVGDKYFVVNDANETVAVVGPEGLSAKPNIIDELDRICPARETLVDFIKRRAAPGASSGDVPITAIGGVGTGFGKGGLKP